MWGIVRKRGRGATSGSAGRMLPKTSMPPAHWLVVLCLLLPVLAGCEQNAGCELVMLARVPVQTSGRLPVVEVSINGHVARMMLDTGAQVSMVSEPAKQRFGLVEDARFLTTAIGLGGSTVKAPVTIDSMAMGGAPLSTDRMAVGYVPAGVVADGIVGMDVLRDYDLDLDGPRRLLSLYRVRYCETADPPWDEVAVPIRGITIQRGRLRMPLEIDGVEGSGLIDTGSAFTVIEQRLAHRLGLTEQTMADDRVGTLHGVGGGNSPTHIHRFQTVQIGPVVIRNVPLLVLTVDPPVLPNGNPMDENLIGEDFLGNRRMWFSFKTQRVGVSRRTGDELAN
jgi:predicted aspartyl protease